ncbi:hypothetical protein JOE44_002054 [Chryseobacterium sp. PvR013]|uniref:hypothetical protein n=1 Tax=Chryseobacterium sp. PvR013 TaxID=2806595 RepID=UPI001AEAA8DC|nr:hypothetical protein [Chryseobacterium sp. PvR013]MBP1165170.1 hypothetical protein [Chryseobacterium sp. PvR013]
MNKIFLIVIAFVTLQSCNGQEKNKVQNSKKIDNSQKVQITNLDENSINFLDAKYQATGFFIPDISNPYPTYTYSDKKMGVFSVDFIGKSNEAQYFWSPNNSKGFFSKSNNPENDAQNSKAIKNLIKENNYYVVASYLPSEFITYTGGEDGEFEPKQNAKTTFYLYEKNKWKQIGEIETSKIPEDILAFETSLIQKEVLKNLKNHSSTYDGTHSTSVETEATTTGMASISYEFDIKKSNIFLSLNTYKESNLCEGKYIGIEKDNQLEIYYSGDQLNCVDIDPKFIIKKDKTQFYIKGVGGESTNNEWILMQ